MRFLKKKAQLQSGQVQAEASDTLAHPASDSKPLQCNSHPVSDTGGAEPPVLQTNPSHKKKKNTGGPASSVDKKAKVDSLLSINSTASFAFDERG